MTETTSDFIEQLMRIEENEENEEQIRELICCVLAENRDEKIKKQCMRKLRSLENAKCIRAEKCEYAYFGLSDFLSSLCLCSEIVLGHTGCRIYADFEEMSLTACPMLIADGTLNLISNAAKFSENGEIEVGLREIGRQAVITVRNRGSVDFRKTAYKSGLTAAASCARLHSGSLFLADTGGFVTASFSASLFLKPTAKMKIPMFSDFLSDEFSCVHIGLADVEW